jgi:hypothetical protein
MSDCTVAYNDIVNVLSDYLGALLQILAHKIDHYSFKMKYTKCGNTGAMLVYLLTGEKEFEKIFYCDVGTVRERHETKIDKKTQISEMLKKDLLQKDETVPSLYYVLLTYEDFPCGDGLEKFFPGHVYLIEKIPPCSPKKKTTKYRFYQSYINKYTLLDHRILNNDTFDISHTRLKKHLDDFEYMMKHNVWDDHVEDYWKSLTFVETKLKGCNTSNLYPCYIKFTVPSAYQNIVSIVQRFISELEVDIAQGDVKKYDPVVEEDDQYAAKKVSPNELLSLMKELHHRLDKLNKSKIK